MRNEAGAGRDPATSVVIPAPATTVIPAQAGIHPVAVAWIPACAGMTPAWRWLSCLILLLATPLAAQTANPILADGRVYTTDPAPLVDGDTLVLLTGRDTAPPGVNDFIMPEWQLLETRDMVHWTHHPAIARPETLFHWAEPGRAYAGQIVKAHGRYWLYAPVLQRGDGPGDRFAIGVGVADSPRGPWRDAHPSGPIVSQTVPVANDIQNIDPTVLIDDDGRVFLIWGTFGQLRGLELAADMTTPIGPEHRLAGLTGFFEAPWLMKRRGTYYMLYAANTAGPDSACTPTLYHACIAYGTAPGPFGPWTYRGVVLKPVSSTTSHPGAVEYRGQWYLAYHTADAVGGGHFRRSVAIDRLDWNDGVTPPAIRPVVPTRRPAPPPGATRNIAGAATAAASNQPLPVRYWIAALNDGRTPPAPLPPELWASRTQARPWIEYRWPTPVRIDGTRLRFFADPAADKAGVTLPAAWHLEYWAGGWQSLPGRYPVAADRVVTVDIPAITTRCLRAVFDAPTGVAVSEWEALAPTPAIPIQPQGTAPPCE